MEDRGETLIPACWEFLTINLFFVLVGFTVLRWGARLLRKCKIVSLLKPFRMTLYLSPLLLEGNLQYFFFLMFSQISNGFSLNPRDKILNIINYFIFFLVFFMAVTSTFLAYWMSRKLAHFLFDNWRVRLRGLLAHFIVNSVRLLLSGAIHSLLRSHFSQLPLLFSIEAIYITCLILFSSFWRAHNVGFNVCFTMGFALLRMGIQVMLIIQQHLGVVGSGSSIEYLIEDILVLLVLIYIIGIYLAILWEFIYEMIDLLKPTKELN